MLVKLVLSDSKRFRVYIVINISHPNLKDVASIKKNFGVLEHNDCADALQVIKHFRLNTSTWNL